MNTQTATVMLGYIAPGKTSQLFDRGLGATSELSLHPLCLQHDHCSGQEPSRGAQSAQILLRLCITEVRLLHQYLGMITLPTAATSECMKILSVSRLWLLP